MKKSIGNCDTCTYIFQCDRCSLTNTLVRDFSGGCPSKLVEDYNKWLEEETKKGEKLK